MRADFRLGDWIVRPRRERIERGGKIVHIHSKPMAVLECLAAAGGEVVTRDELFDTVWPGLVVSDDALTQCVVELRKAFGDSARDAQIIRTVPRVGFCLIPPVSSLDEERPAAGGKWMAPVIGLLAVVAIIFALYKLVSTGDEPATATVAAKDTASIAVLPFVNMSSDPEQEYFSDGISEELLNLLAKIPGLRVISHTSAFAFKGKDIDVPTIARQLGVTHILEGSVRNDGNQIRITAQLVEAHSDTHLWSQTYDRDFTEVFAIQDEIARHVVDEVEVTLLGAYPRSAPADPEAFRLYLLGKHHHNKYEFHKAVQYYQQAIALDPQYAQAHLALAEVYGGQTFFGYMSPRQGYAQIKAEIALVREIDDELAGAHSPIAEMNFYFDWEWDKAEAGFQRAISEIPSDANAHKLYAWFLSAMGRMEQAQDAIGRALELEPLDPGMYLTASNVLYGVGLHDQAIARCREALELSPNHSLALSQIGWSYVQMGLFDAAISVMERSVNSFPPLLQNLWMLGHAYAVAGKTTEARKVLGELHDRAEKQYVPPFGFALVHAGLGEKDEAIDWLERAYEDRSGWMVYLNVSPLLDPLRGEPRFQDLLKRMNFPD